MRYSASTGGFYDPAIHKIIPDDAVDVSIAEHAALLAAQATGKVISADAEGRPVASDPPPPSLDQLKADKIKELESDFAAEYYGLVDYLGHQFQADIVSTGRLNDVLSAYASDTLPVGFYWLSADNTKVPMDYAQLQNLAKAMADSGWGAFKKLQDLKDAVNSATAETLSAIHW
jgi:hypothetical protein